MKKVSIIGAGIGGLCTAIRLLHKGYSVTIYEKNSFPGGCIHYTHSPDNLFQIDTSASLAINPLTYEEIFTDIGKNPRDYFNWIPLENNYKVFWSKGYALHLKNNLIQTQKELIPYFSQDLVGYTQFVFDTSLKYLSAKNKLLNKSFITTEEVYNLSTLKNVLSLQTFTSANQYLKGFIHSRDLRELILFQTFFMGISPYRLPNIYTAIAANTQLEGLGHIKGGLAAYIKGLEKLFYELGGQIHYNSPVERLIYTKQAIKHLKVKKHLIASDLIICNTDYIYSQETLLKRKNLPSFDLSCSTFILHLGLNCKFSQLDVHNLYINNDFKKEIERVFQGHLPIAPCLYIYYPSAKDNSFCKNASHSVMNIMVRVPHLQSLTIKWCESTKERLAHQCLSILETLPGLKTIRQNILYQSFTTPKDFKTTYNYHNGCCFGIGHTFLQSLMFRPQVRDSQFNNLYYVGASIHPGNGASIVMDCAKLLVNEISSSSL